MNDVIWAHDPRFCSPNDVSSVPVSKHEQRVVTNAPGVPNSDCLDVSWLWAERIMVLDVVRILFSG